MSWDRHSAQSHSLYLTLTATFRSTQPITASSWWSFAPKKYAIRAPTRNEPRHDYLNTFRTGAITEMETTATSAYFFDLGGTLLRVKDDEIWKDNAGHVELLPGVPEKLKSLHGKPVFVLTNQSGIEKGLLTTQEVADFIAQINERCESVVVDYWACPYITSGYRKPSPSMLLGLADKHFIDLGCAIMVGDSDTDKECARRAGVGRFIWASEYFGCS